MPTPSFFILYVKDIHKSVDFYEKLFGAPPVDNRPGFSLFVWPNGQKFGLWLTGTVEPEAEMTGGGGEYCIALPNEASLRESFEAAEANGLAIAQTPTQMGFGLTYVVEDPDRHRIRYYVPAAA